MSNICTNDVLNANVDVDGVLKAASSLSPTCDLVLVVFMFIVCVLSSYFTVDKKLRSSSSISTYWQIYGKFEIPITHTVHSWWH